GFWFRQIDEVANMTGPWQPMHVVDEGLIYPIPGPPGPAGPAGPLGPPGAPALASIAALRQNTATNSPLNVAQYYASGNLAGGGAFHLDLADTTSLDDGFLVVADAAGHRWKRIIGAAGINAYMAGAKGDAVIDDADVVTGTDDTAAINKLFDYVRSAKNANADIAPVKVA